MADLKTVSAEVVRVFLEKNLTLGTAESLTGGMIAASIAGVSGASAVLMGGVVSYDSRVKHEVLGVEQQIIDTVGVVSARCAREMAAGVKRISGADWGVSATGLAGPDGGTDEFYAAVDADIVLIPISFAGAKDMRLPDRSFCRHNHFAAEQAMTVIRACTGTAEVDF